MLGGEQILDIARRAALKLLPPSHSLFQDAISEGYVAIIRVQARSPENPYAYFYSVAYHAIIRFLKKETRIPVRHVEEEDSDLCENFSAPLSRVEDLLSPRDAGFAALAWGSLGEKLSPALLGYVFGLSERQAYRKLGALREELKEKLRALSDAQP
jgi:DNA-directed RNA polymerase specialized sigma24 family protein